MDLGMNLAILVTAFALSFSTGFSEAMAQSNSEKRSEIASMYEDSLANWIKDDTRGDYEKALINLIGEDE